MGLTIETNILASPSGHRPLVKHHDYANLFPMLADAELQTLADDIRENGQQMPVTLYEGKILDGRNRWRACELAGIEPTSEFYRGKDPLGFVISHNLHRRHLTESQRAMVGAKWAVLKHGAPEGNKRASKTESPIGDSVSQSAKKTRDEAAEMLNVGTSSIDRAKKIQREGVPELIAAVEAGEVTVNAARHVVSIPKEEQAALMAEGAQAVTARANEIRKMEKPQVPEPAPDPEPLVVDGTEDKPKRVSPYRPNLAGDCWQAAAGRRLGFSSSASTATTFLASAS